MVARLDIALCITRCHCFFHWLILSLSFSLFFFSLSLSDKSEENLRSVGNTFCCLSRLLCFLIPLRLLPSFLPQNYRLTNVGEKGKKICQNWIILLVIFNFYYQEAKYVEEMSEKWFQSNFPFPWDSTVLFCIGCEWNVFFHTESIFATHIYSVKCIWFGRSTTLPKVFYT